VPCTWHHTDVDGRPCFVVKVGEIRLNDLVKLCGEEMFKRFVVRELEHTWREKFPLTKSD
jgi:hypothetical protein